MPNKKNKKIKKHLKAKPKKDKRPAHKKINIYSLIIYLFLITAVVFSTFIAVYKHRKALTALNKANEIMMTNTGIVIDSVNIQSFQEAEFILNEKIKAAELPNTIRDVFLYDRKINVKSISEPQEDSIDDAADIQSTPDTNEESPNE